MNEASSYTRDQFPELAALLTRRLAEQPYLEFAYCVQEALERHGYVNAVLTDRWSLKGRTKQSGFDMSIEQETDLGCTPLLVSLKRYKEVAVSASQVIAFRGCLVNRHVPAGIIVTTSTFSKPARLAAASYAGRPVRLIDGRELGQMLVDAGIGVMEGRDLLTGERRLYYNEHVFELVGTYCDRVRASRREGRRR